MSKNDQSGLIAYLNEEASKKERELTKLRAERDELVGALEDLRKYVKRAPFGTLTEADRALAKHKPE